jgi:hypothetical protein
VVGFGIKEGGGGGIRTLDTPFRGIAGRGCRGCSLVFKNPLQVGVFSLLTCRVCSPLCVWVGVSVGVRTDRILRGFASSLFSGEDVRKPRRDSSLFIVSAFLPAKRKLLRVGDAGLEPADPPCKGEIGRCRGLPRVAYPAYLSQFLFYPLPIVAGCCARGGVRVVSIDVGFQMLVSSIGELGDA